MSGALEDALAVAVTAAGPDRRDAAAVMLLALQARAIDEDPRRLERIGPAMLRGLEAMGLTLHGRGGADGDEAGEQQRGPFDALRSRRRDRGQLSAEDRD